jgi:chromosome partitioning protein
MTIALSNQKGGVGKTTSTINVGAYMAKLGKKVLLVDLDPQANLTSGLGIQLKEDEYSIYACISENSGLRAIIKQTDIADLHVVPASIELAGAEVELVNAISRESTLKSLLSEVIDDYDFVLIDCPPSLGLLTVNALVASDAVVIPVQSEYFALEGLNQLLNTITLVKKKINPGLDILGIIITLYDSRTNLAKDVARELVNSFGDKVLNTVIPRNVRLSEAPSHGEPVTTFAPESQGGKSYASLTKELLNKAGVK